MKNFKGEYMMNISMISKNNCTGCSACIAVCPRKCIEMRVDEEQFNYPKIDEKDCIDCGLCLKNMSSRYTYTIV